MNHINCNRVHFLDSLTLSVFILNSIQPLNLKSPGGGAIVCCEVLIVSVTIGWVPVDCFDSPESPPPLKGSILCSPSNR